MNFNVPVSSAQAGRLKWGSSSSEVMDGIAALEFETILLTLDTPSSELRTADASCRKAGSNSNNRQCDGTYNKIRAKDIASNGKMSFDEGNIKSI